MHGFVPALTSFVGRDAEVARIAALLGEYRLVTVTGPGGVGKTRLACEVARRAAARYADGVWLVELAAVRDPALVPAAIVAALGIPPSPDSTPAQTLAAVLSRRQLLLVLDNCEHVLDAAAELCGELLPAADEVTVLATSREPLGIAGETRYRLGPLPVPVSAGQGAGSAAVQLFAERARQADPSFDLAGGNAELTARLVTRLDGMPLAIELAAARLEALGLSQLLDRLHLLSGGDRRAPARQQSLAATIDWSYQLLTGGNAPAFRQLAIFPGPFSLDAAEDMTGVSSGPAVLHLVDCSLLIPPRPDLDGRSRYAMLETIRAFGRERLTEAGEEQETAAALTRYAVTAAESAAAGLQTGTGELAAVRWLDAETSTVEQALAWSLEHDHASAARLAAALGPWWMLRGRTADAERNLRAAALLTDPGSHLWCRLQLLLGDVTQAGSMGQAHVLVNMYRLDEGTELARACLDMSRGIGYPAGVAWSMFTLSYACFHAGHADEAVSWAQQAIEIDRAQIPGVLSRMCGVQLANSMRRAGDGGAALRTCADVMAQATAADDLTVQVMVGFLRADLDTRAGGMWTRSSVRDVWSGRTAAGVRHSGHFRAPAEALISSRAS